MRRTAAVLLTTAALVVGFVSPANAATTVVKTLAVDMNTFGTGTYLSSVPCTGTALDTTPAAPPHTVIFPSMAVAPSGSTAVAWGQHFGATQAEADAWGVVTNIGSASDLGTFSLDAYDATSGVVVVQAGSSAEHWAGKASVTGTAGQWSTINGAAQTLSWTQYSTTTNQPTGATASGTIAQFAAAHPSFDIFFGLIGFGCDSHDFRFQNLRTGTAASPNDTQFGTLTDNVQIKPSAGFIAAGGSVSLGGSAQYGGATYATLNSKAANSSAYVTTNRSVAAMAVDDLTCDSNFVCRNQFSAPVLHPAYNTIYKWAYPSGNGVDGAVSTYITVHVQAVISAAFPSSIASGRRFTVNGKVTPLRPGTLVGLWARNGYTTSRIGVATVTSAGTYSINASVGSGTWTLWLTTANDKLNAAGKSASKTYTVR